jgi:hypothetical protein
MLDIAQMKVNADFERFEKITKLFYIKLSCKQKNKKKRRLFNLIRLRQQHQQ